MSWGRIALDNTLADGKSSDGRLVILTQIALIFFLSTLALTGASVQSYLDQNLNQMLGADMSLSGSRALSDSEQSMIAGQSGEVTYLQLVPLAVSYGENTLPAQVKLVEANYPLRGTLQIGADLDQVSAIDVDVGPAVGEIWLGPRISKKFGAKIGDSIEIGGQTLIFTAILFHEPDRLAEGHSVAMRALANRDSLPLEYLRSSRTTHRTLIAASPTAQESLANWASANLNDYTVVTKTSGGHPLALFWQRVENFLGLASVILFFLAAIAIDMANRCYLKRQMQRLAIYLSFGQSLSACLRLAVAQWFFGFVLSVLIGLGLALVAQWFLVRELADQFPGISAQVDPIVIAMTTGLIFLLLLAFQVPMLLQLRRTSLVSLIRAVEYPSAQWVRLFWGAASVSLLATYFSDNGTLTWMTLGALAAALCLMLLLSWVVLTLGELWGRARPGLLSFNFFIMKQRIVSKSSQILGLGLCSLLLLFTLMLMKDIGATMEGYSRTNNGNLMIAELHSGGKQSFDEWIAANDAEIRQLRPYTGAKLTLLNGQPIAQTVTTPSETLAVVGNSIRLSWSEQVPDNNRVTAGAWWGPSDEAWQQISAEDEVIADLGLEFGDKLTLMIGGNPVEFELVASHAFKPGSGSVTFWFQVPQRAFEAIGPDVFYMGSAELPEEAWAKLGGLWQDNPTLSLVPLKEITQRFDETLALVTKLVVGFAGMVFIMTTLVIAASMRGFEAEDRQKNGLLMSMGVSKVQCVKLALYDWLTIAMIAGLGAIAGTWLAGLLIYQSQFSMTYTPAPVWLVATMLVVGLCVCGLGVLYSRSSLSISVTSLLNESAT